jgi:hypothetical protein
VFLVLSSSLKYLFSIKYKLCTWVKLSNLAVPNVLQGRGIITVKLCSRLDPTEDSMPNGCLIYGNRRSTALGEAKIGLP